SARVPHGVFGALAAAERAGGPHVEGLKSTATKVPIGTTENSPRFQPWVESGEWPEPQRGDRRHGTGPVRSFVPDWTRFMFAPQPSDKSLGYFRASLRDVESRHAKQIPWERGRARGLDIATRPVPEIVKIRESSGTAGG